MDHSQWIEKNKQKRKVQCLYNSAKEKGMMLLLLFGFFLQVCILLILQLRVIEIML